MALLLFVNIYVGAQKLSNDFTVSTAAPYEVIDAGSNEDIPLDNGFVIMAKMGRGLVHLQKLDVNGMKEVSRKTYDDLPKGAYFQDVLKLGKRVYYFYEVKDKKDTMVKFKLN